MSGRLSLQSIPKIENAHLVGSAIKVIQVCIIAQEFQNAGDDS